MTQLYLIRHGQTDWNLEKKLQGQTDIPLNETGREQARTLAQKLKNETFHAVYSSPLKRAHETAQIINHLHGHEINLHDDLMEASYGFIEGMKIEEFQQKATVHAMDRHGRLHHKLDPSAESYFEVYHRVRPFLDSLLQKHHGQNILIITHGALMRSIMAIIEDIDLQEIHIPNAGCLILQEKDSTLSVITSLLLDT